MNEEQGEAAIRLDQLARLTGLSPVLIRAWERRYGLPVAERTEGGHRRYSRAQAELLRRAALMVRSGFRAADAVARARAGEEGPRAGGAGAGIGVEELTGLLVAGEVTAAIDRLRGAWQTIGFESALEELALPALAAVGEGWAGGTYSVAEEHVATGAVMSWLGAVRAELPARDLGPVRYLVATPEGEQHAVGVWALELLLRLRSVSAVALGSSVPADDLAREARRVGPEGVVLAILRPSLRRAAAAAAARLRALPDGGPVVYLGGAGARGPLPAGVQGLPPGMVAAADFLAARVRG